MVMLRSALQTHRLWQEHTPSLVVMRLQAWIATEVTVSLHKRILGQYVFSSGSVPPCDCTDANPAISSARVAKEIVPLNYRPHNHLLRGLKTAAIAPVLSMKNTIRQLYQLRFLSGAV